MLVFSVARMDEERPKAFLGGSSHSGLCRMVGLGQRGKHGRKLGDGSMCNWVTAEKLDKVTKLFVHIVSSHLLNLLKALM